jgi:hypothetical protein
MTSFALGGQGLTATVRQPRGYGGEAPSGSGRPRRVMGIRCSMVEPCAPPGRAPDTAR